MVKLGVNLDHVATIRQQRYTPYPDMLKAIKISEDSGADSITMHLREDRRHIQFNDIKIAREHIKTKLNLEMAPTLEMCEIANQVKPDFVCIVPEKRQELTTEGGLDVVSQLSRMKEVCAELSSNHIKTSLFIDADKDQIDAAVECGVPIIEIHTGHYANSSDDEELNLELQRIIKASEYAHSLGLQVNAGHGLTMANTKAIAAINDMVELNIGHSIIARSLFVGLANATSEMKQLLQEARS